MLQKGDFMRFYLPVKLYQEKNCVAAHASEMAAFGTKALLVTGRHSAEKNGSLADVTAALKQFGVSYEIFAEVEENPSVETILRGRDKGLAAGADFVIGIGGGSPMDASKVISLMMKHSEEGADYLFDGTKPSDAYPVVCIPTTCGTGSEVTGVSVLSRSDLQIKQASPHKIFPDLSLVDGKYLKAAPLKVLRNTSVDAFGHLVESFINTTSSAFSRAFVLEGLRIWKTCKPVLLGDKAPDQDDLDNLITASTFGGMAIAHANTTLPHALSYALTYEAHIPHGQAIGYFQAGYIKEAPQAMQEEVLREAGFRDTTELAEFYAAVCGKPDVPEEVLLHGIEQTVNNAGKIALTPFNVDETVLRRISGLA